MPLTSMTGFARSDGEFGGVRWHWEVRSVNGRGLDVRVRLAQGAEGLEALVRAAVARHVTRGSVSVNLAAQRQEAAPGIRINEPALEAVLAAIAKVQAGGTFDRPRPESVLALRGVMEVSEPKEDEAAAAARNEAMLATLDTALTELGRARASEGQRLEPVLLAQVAGIEKLVAAVAQSPSRAPDTIKARLREQVQRLVEANVTLDGDRLHQEAVMIATRIDVDEELKRLTSHVAAARELIAAREPVGRKLDFLTQEFNREANTLCSKANAIDITRAGLELKAIIDQMREQVQNIE